MSDFVLSAAAFYACATAMVCHDFVAALGFAAVGCAAALGVLRFGGFVRGYHDLIFILHRNAAFLASCIGIPWIAASYWKIVDVPYLSAVLCAIPLGLVAWNVTSISGRKTMSQALPAISVVSIIILSVFTRTIAGVCGGLLVALSALPGTEGTGMFGVLNVDVFHYVLALGMASLGRSISPMID